MSLQKFIRDIHLKSTFDELGLGSLYEWLRIHIIMNQTHFIIITAALIIGIFIGIHLDSKLVEYFCIILAVFFVFFKFTMLI